MIDSTRQSKAFIFPCDCCCEGLVVVKQDDDFNECDGAPFINIALYRMGSYDNNKLSWRERLRWIWRIIRVGNPYEDMVSMRSNVARNFAYHILYLLREKSKKPNKDLLVKMPEDDHV